MKRHSIRSMMVPALLMIAVLASGACAPAAADQPTSTSPTTGAMLSAEGTPITVCVDDCVFEGNGVNRGLSCAADIKGTTRVVATDGRTLARVDWTLSPSWVVRPGESFLFDGCCFDKSVMAQSINYQTDFQWNDVPCSDS